MIRTHWLAALPLVCLSASLAGCSSSADGRPARSASEQALAFKHARCGAYSDESAIANILSGKAVEAVAPLYVGGAYKTTSARLEGASIYVQPSPGQTAEWLDRALECHSASRTSGSAASLGPSTDPFFLPGSVVTIHVVSAGDGYRVDVESTSSDDAREILARATAFAGSALQGVAAQPELP